MWLPLWLFACSPSEALAPPPPRLLTVEAGTAIAGQSLRVLITGATPLTMVDLYASSVGPVGCADPICPLASPVLVVSVAVPWDGIGLSVVPIPADAGLLWLQAIRRGPDSAASQPVQLTIRPDGDGDGLPDDDEAVWGTDPSLPDTDGDRALDATEVAQGLDPLAPDTDGDGWTDGIDFTPLTPGPQDSWTAIDNRATLPGTTLSDPEFHGSGAFIWQVGNGYSLWLAAVDPNTGEFTPRDGRGTLIDQGLTGFDVSANGPEWVDTAQGPLIAYSRRLQAGVHALAYARHDGGAWVASEVVGREEGWRPYGQHVPGASRGRVLYRVGAGEVEANGWRALDADEGEVLPPELWHFGTRFALHDEHIIQGPIRVDGFNQVFQYDIRDGAWEVLTTDPTDKQDPFLVSLPEWGGDTGLVAMRGRGPDDFDEMVLYREVGGAWTEQMVIRPPPAWPVVVSPEVFHWNGRTWLVFVGSEWHKEYHNGPAHLFVASLDPARPMVRRVSGDVDARRGDVEIHIGGRRPWVFYKRAYDGRVQVRRCEVGPL